MKIRKRPFQSLNSWFKNSPPIWCNKARQSFGTHLFCQNIKNWITKRRLSIDNAKFSYLCFSGPLLPSLSSREVSCDPSGTWTVADCLPPLKAWREADQDLQWCEHQSHSVGWCIKIASAWLSKEGRTQSNSQPEETDEIDLEIFENLDKIDLVSQRPGRSLGSLSSWSKYWWLLILHLVIHHTILSLAPHPRWSRLRRKLMIKIESWSSKWGT